MSFSATEKATLAEILGISDYALDLHLDGITLELSTEAEDIVQADIVLWATYRDDYVLLIEKDKNFGARIDAERNRQAIRQRVATKLEFELTDSASGIRRLYRA